VSARRRLGNLGFAIGFYGGRRLLERYQKTLHIRPDVIARGEELFCALRSCHHLCRSFHRRDEDHRGPLAGVLRMSWRKFLLFNFLGAVLWVSVIASLGYLFGKHWEALVDLVQDANSPSRLWWLFWSGFSGGGGEKGDPFLGSGFPRQLLVPDTLSGRAGLP